MARITFSEIHVSFNKRNELTGHFVTFTFYIVCQNLTCIKEVGILDKGAIKSSFCTHTRSSLAYNDIFPSNVTNTHTRALADE